MERDPMESALSTEVVMDVVLSHLNVNDLLSCRLASKLWSTVASRVLRLRSTLIKTISDEEDLLKLDECMRQSSDFPFSGLRFDQPWLLDSDGATEFFHNFGASFTRLRLDTRWVIRLHDLAPFICHLRRLSILEMGLSHRPNVNWVHSEHEDGRILQLPSVQTIRILKPHTEVNEYVLREVVMAASPSLQIECLEVTPEILRALKSSGRLQAISDMRFDKNYENKAFALEMDLLLSAEAPSLTKLDFDVGACISKDGLQALLLSSQNTLKELYMFGMCLFEESWNEFPIFTKLTKLSVSNRKGYCHGHVCKGTYSQKFPALKELQLDMSYERYKTLGNSSSDGVFLVSSVTKIDFPGYFDNNGIRMLAQWFPNVTEVGLQYPSNSSCCAPGGNDPFKIWNVREFKRLEKLRICRWSAKSSSSMDSFLTGMTSNPCPNLRAQIKMDFSNSPSHEVWRVKPNILQLKSLKELIVCMEPGFTLPTEVTPFMSMFSVKYALRWMPNLQMKFIYGHHSPYSRIREKATMETVFKDVLPHIQLEFSPY